MRTLVVDCTRSRNVQDLVSAVSPFSETNVVRFEMVGKDCKAARSVDAVVISGSGYRSVRPTDRRRFAGVLDLIKSFEGPVLGVCFAHQLVGFAFSAKLATLKQPVYDKFEQMRIVEPDELFDGHNPGDLVSLAEYHNDYVVKEGLSEAGFILLADSQSCEVEAIKFASKPVYGMQFHAERNRIGKEEHGEGLKVFANFYERVVRK